MTVLVLFRLGEHRSHLVPARDAASAWGPGTAMRGMAVSAALAREAQHHVVSEGGRGWTPGRWTVDFSRPALMQPSTMSACSLRRGRRLTLVDVEMVQGDDVVVARARGAFLRAGGAASGTVWQPQDPMEAPPVTMSPLPGESRLFWSEGVGWSGDPDDHQAPTRKRLWQLPFELVEGEALDPFPFVAGVADIASVVTQWGDRGVQHINVDLSLHLARIPESVEDGVGVASVHRIATGGQTIGTAALYDGRGALGSASVTALQNEAHVNAAQLRSSHDCLRPSSY